MAKQPRKLASWPDHLLREFPSSRRYLIGVSGGRDSAALLHWLIESGYQRLIVCHLDHRLRGRASRADAAFVERLAGKHRLSFEYGSADVKALASERKESIETAARAARYAFFADVARRRRCRTIFLAHHGDDLVETFLINLFRGAGGSGLSAMREVTKRRIDGVDLTIVRPLLSIWRNEIDAYVRKQSLKFREDASNRSLEPLRNRVRHRVIPYLEKTFGRNIRQNIWRTATIAGEEEIFFETLLPKDLTDVAALAVEPLRKMSVTVQRRMLHQWLRASNVGGVGFDLIERVRQLLDTAGRIAKTNLPRDRHVRRRAGKIFIE
jgi:tRNA(Ile)-lysidine synthase